MPTKIYTRTWCNTCKEFTLHHKPFEKDFQCKDCGDSSKTYNPKDIPDEKYREQIQRWKNSENRQFSKMFNSLLNPSSFHQMNWFDERNEVVVKEDDLGYEKRRNELRASEESERKAKKEEQERLKSLYKGLTRNDKCGCGSGLKFKNCCQSKINEIIY